MGASEILTKMPTPTFDPLGGAFPDDSIEVTVQNQIADAVIRYTTNGSVPDESSASVVVGTAVQVPVPGILKASAWKSGVAVSDIAVAYYEASTINGIPVDWLDRHGLPADGSADFTYRNGHRLTVWEAWLAGIDPNDPSDDMRMTGAPSFSAQGMHIRWRSVNTRTYRVERSTGLTANPPFIPIVTGVRGVDGETEFVDETATDAGPFFYRVVVE